MKQTRIMIKWIILITLIVIPIGQIYSQQNYIYFSPNESPGIKDHLEIGLTGFGEDSWLAFINDMHGDRVWDITWEGNPNRSIEWNGTNNDGEFLPDGVYTIIIEGLDRAGNFTSRTFPGLVIDNTPPVIEADADFYIVSPQASPGIRDQIVFSHEGDGNDSYVGTVYSVDDRTIWTTTWTDNPDREVLWRCLDNQNNPVPEGTYRYVVTATDLAGNSDEYTVGPLVVDNTPPVITTALNYEYFSPNDDEERDTVTFTNSGSGGIRWVVMVKNTDGDVVFSMEVNSEVLQPAFEWDGKGNNGTVVPDGPYNYVVQGFDEAGNSGESRALRVNVDTVPPQVEIRVRTSFFSPNDDGILDEVEFSHTNPDNDVVQSYVEVFDANDELVFSEPLSSINLVEEYSWSGMTNAGNVAPDGMYEYRVYVRDIAGNLSYGAMDNVEVITTQNQATVNSSHLYFSPKKKLTN